MPPADLIRHNAFLISLRNKKSWSSLQAPTINAEQGGVFIIIVQNKTHTYR